MFPSRELAPPLALSSSLARLVLPLAPPSLADTPPNLGTGLSKPAMLLDRLGLVLVPFPFIVASAEAPTPPNKSVKMSSNCPRLPSGRSVSVPRVEAGLEGAAEERAEAVLASLALRSSASLACFAAISALRLSTV